MIFRENANFSASKIRLEKLIKERIDSADKKAVDEKIWELFGETWAVMFTDLSGFSRHVAEFGITHFLQTIYESQRLLIPVIEEFGGIMLKVEGDSFLVIFRSPESAVQSAVKMQRILDDYNKDKPEAEKVLLCLGIGYGRMLRIGDDDVFGVEVNAASKLGEDIADSREIYVTDAVKRHADISDIEFKQADIKLPGVDAVYQVIYGG